MRVFLPFKSITIMILCIVSFMCSSFSEYLDIPMLPQEKSSWCWAASTGAILLFYKTPGFTKEKTQEKILMHVKGSLVNKGGTSSEMRKALKMGNTSPQHLNTYSEANLRKDCDAGNSLMVNVAWNSGGAHATTYAGYQGTGSEAKYKIMNPWPPNKGEWQYFTYKSLKTWNGKGKWNYSLTTKKNTTHVKNASISTTANVAIKKLSGQSLTLLIPYHGEYIMNVYNMNGRKVMRLNKVLSKGLKTIKWQNYHLPENLYLVSIKSSKISFSTKTLVTK